MANRKRIEKVQKKAIRIVTGSAYNDHTKPLFLQHAILPFDKLILQSQLTFMHSIEYKFAPSWFNLVWIKNSEREPLINLRNADDYYLPMPRTEAFKNLLHMHCHSIGMNYSLKFNTYQENPITFKWALKAHLLESISDD